MKPWGFEARWGHENLPWLPKNADFDFICWQNCWHRFESIEQLFPSCGKGSKAVAAALNTLKTPRWTPGSSESSRFGPLHGAALGRRRRNVHCHAVGGTQHHSIQG